MREPTYCAFCPKLCTHACPVSRATRRETHTPWGKQTTLWEARRGLIRMSAGYVEPRFACAGCHACTDACDHAIDVASSLDGGRALAFDEGLLPGPISRLHRDQPARERAARDGIASLGGAHSPGQAARTVLFPGCSAAIGDPALVASAASVFREMAGDSAAIYGDRCCGLPYLQAGDVAGFVEAARKLAADLRGVGTIVALAPGCALALRKRYPAAGVDVEAEVLTLPEFVLPHMRRLARRTSLEAPVFYHDPCQLGRGLGVYEEPREILLRLVAGGARDLHLARASGPCCGGGGAIPATMPDAASSIVGRLVGLLRDQGAATVVTACPTCLQMISAAGGIAAVDITTLMARAL